MTVNLRKSLCAAVLTMAAASAANAAATDAVQGRGSETVDRALLDTLNPSIPLDIAARIVAQDHPMGWQIRMHEGPSGQPGMKPRTLAAADSVDGMDVSGYQGNVDWTTAYNNGASFAYVKATEGTTYTNPYFDQQYSGSYNVGMIRGAYHFARPDNAGGAEQADYFVDNGGNWTGDGATLPGAVDLEYNPKGATCYGLSQDDMAAWIGAFSDEYASRTGRYPVIYTSTSWWSQCVGSAGNFAANSPLWVARYASSVGALPYGWDDYSFWQYADSGTYPGDQDTYNGSYDQLQGVANGQ